MIIVAAAMSMQSLGLKAFANEICESYVAEESTFVAQDKTQEQILSDAVFEAHQALMTKKAWLCHIIWLIFNRKYCLIIVDK